MASGTWVPTWGMETSSGAVPLWKVKGGQSEGTTFMAMDKRANQQLALVRNLGRSMAHHLEAQGIQSPLLHRQRHTRV